MNRNTKHPGRSYRRKTSAGDTTKNTKAWRITASWDARPDRPAVKVTSDRKAMRRTVREWSEQGAYVIVEEHAGYGAYRTLYEVDGPALVAERLAAEQAAAEAAERERLLAEQRAQQAAAEQRRRRPPRRRGHRPRPRAHDRPGHRPARAPPARPPRHRGAAMTPAAVAVIRAAIEDAHLAEILNRPGQTAQRIAQALDDAGWTLAPGQPNTGPQQAA